MPKAAVLMVMGTSSSAGKSLLTAGLCRLFANRGIKVAPFKSQNMSNNAAVCPDGSEIGRSQALQALAARQIARSDFNPILLKPEGNAHSQVILNGKPWEGEQGNTLGAADYFRKRDELWPHVTSALDRLRDEFELVVIEGAGSPAELNLNQVEIVNMAVARYCQANVLLVGDIERGGVFAQLLGTLWLLEPRDKELIRGLIVNKFRGDLRLFDSGVQILEERGGVPVFGVLPWLENLNLPEEDAIALTHPVPDENPSRTSSEPSDCELKTLDVAVIHLPHVANFDDFDPLQHETFVKLRWVKNAEQLDAPDVVILPGTKNTIDDLKWMKSAGLDSAIRDIASNRNCQVIGICGGYQMLGNAIYNPHGLESSDRSATGLGLLDHDTWFEGQKQTCIVTARLENRLSAFPCDEIELHGYEIHVGKTRGSRPWLRRFPGTREGLEESLPPSQSSEINLWDGNQNEMGNVWGCYLHGLFANDVFRQAWLAHFGVISRPVLHSTAHEIDLSLNRLAQHLETHLDIAAIETFLSIERAGDPICQTN